MEPEEAVVDAAVDELEGALAALRPRFRRRRAHAHAAAYARGLVAEVERKNGWQLAEWAGDAHPRSIERVLDRSVWDADAVVGDVRALVVDRLGDPSGVLVVDETGFLKKGTKSCGVARQYSGTAGRVENCQVGVFLGYAGPRGRAGIDRALYLPKEWAEDPDRRRAAGVPEGTAFRTKPRLAREMVARALDAGVPAAWVVADEVYGAEYAFRAALEERGQPYVLAVASAAAQSTWPPHGPAGQHRVGALAAALGPDAWERLSCGAGAQGPRVYDWARAPLRPALRAGWHHALLVRRHPSRTDELAYYLVFCPDATPLAEVVRAAGARWAIEDAFKLAKGQVGLDQYETRSWRGWHRHTALALLALAVLAVGAAKGDRPPSAWSPSPSPSSAAS
jgi:SRSO17 transposase